jgi:hypothetical protein
MGESVECLRASFEYKLDESEIAETLLCLNHRREGYFKKWNVYALTLVGFALLVVWARNIDRFYIFAGLVADVGVLFYILYGKPAARKYKAKKLMMRGGVYRMSIVGCNIVFGDDDKKCTIDNKCALFESESVVTINSSAAVFCIPRRVLLDGQLEDIERIAESVGCKKYILKTKN